MKPTSYGQAKSLGYRVTSVTKKGTQVKVTMQLPVATQVMKRVVEFIMTEEVAKKNGLKVN